ncbi:uncharacterized protein LOC116265446 isoform X2 [Nymphaea colorata]|uniref:uncharacterized protein LOC116265446 isoform X2 n=1 Tax=Nymphaea colorata TaxID=210225 RepID=UPI00129DAB5B|nr:uncharacterized protein LOC116265446 isoform X2 [Nymphaea colorata]
MDPKTDRLVRRLTMVGTATATYFLLTADYGPYPNALDPIKDVIQSAQHSVKKLIFKTGEEPHNEDSEPNSGHGKGRA